VAAYMYRIKKGKVHASGSAVIEDRGYLYRAASAGDKNFLFSERGAGVDEMALVGTRQEIMIWLGQHYLHRIENRIADLPDIFLGVEPYVPGQRYKGLFPLHDTLKAIFDSSVGIFGPGNTSTDIIGGANDLKAALEFKPEIGHSERRTPPKYSGELYIKFSYLQGEKMEWIASNQISLKTVRELLQKVI